MRNATLIAVLFCLVLLSGCAAMQNPYEPGTVQYEQWETRRQLSMMQFQQQMQQMRMQQTLTNIELNTYRPPSVLYPY